MNAVELTMKAQKDVLKRANNERFFENGVEYVIRYEGGIAEYVGVYGRRNKNQNFRFAVGFNGYLLEAPTVKDVIAYANQLVREKFSNSAN